MTAPPPSGRGPTPVGAGLAIAGSLAAAGLVAVEPVQLLPLTVQALGGTLLVGVLLADAGRVARGVGAVGCGVAVLAGVAACLALPVALELRLVSLTTASGVALVVAGVVPLRSSWARGFVIAGTGTVLFGGLAAGSLFAVGRVRLFAAVAAAVLAWDAGDRAVGLGETVGREATTADVELGGTAASGAVALLAVPVALAAGALPGGELPTVVLGVILFGVVALALSLTE